jgi:penicillin amidase
MVQAAFDSTILALRSTHTDTLRHWAWGLVQDTYVPHLANIQPFGAYHLNAPGCPLCVNSTKPKNGPSWRMVVALNPNAAQMEAYGLYPGGQSGNPGSPWYENMIPAWVRGELPKLQFAQKPEQVAAFSTWSLTTAQ